MSTTTEKEITVADGLGSADASQVLYGATFSSEDGFNIEGTFIPDASNITYNDTTVEVALDELTETTNNLPSAGTKLIETLPAGETTVTFTSDEITEDTTLNAVYTSIFGVKLESANVENGVLTLTFEAQEEDMTVVALINATMSDSDETNLGDIDADEVKVDDTNLGLGVTNVQGALEKLKENAGENVDGEIEVIKDTLGYTTKNLLENTATTTTSNGITFTVNDDGSVTVDGTATENTGFELNTNVSLPNGEYILSGCPEGGQGTTYYIQAYCEEVNKFDFGTEQGVTFTINNNVFQYVRIFIKSGYTVNNLTFYPMIRKASVTDDTYEPYTPSVDVRLDTVESSIRGIDTSNKLYSFTASGYDGTNDMSYVAEKDCYAFIRYYGASTAKMCLDNLTVFQTNDKVARIFIIPIKKGQKVRGYTNDGVGSYVTCEFYGLL